MHSREGGDGEALELALRTQGVLGRIVARGKLAVFTPEQPTIPDARLRRRLVALAREHGFTNLAMELVAPDANISRD